MDLETPKILALRLTSPESLNKGLKLSGLQVHHLRDEKLLSKGVIKLYKCLESKCCSNVIAIMRVSEEETWPELTAPTVKGTGEANQALNHEGGGGTFMRKAEAKPRLLPARAAASPG